MDVKRVESLAVPTALAAVSAGTVAYSIPKTITKNGELSDTFVKFLSVRNEVSDLKKIAEADSLDKIASALPTEEELRTLGSENREANLKTLLEVKSKNRARAIENFVIRNSEVLDVHPEKGQSLRDAAREYVKGKSIEEIKEAFLPTPMRRAMESTDYEKLFKETFAEVYDKTAKKFKSGEAIDETVRMFKRSARQLNFAFGASWAFVAGGIALLSSFLATKIANK